MLLESDGFRIHLPARWEGAVSRAPAPVAGSRSSRSGQIAVTPPVVHLSSAALPAVRGDFGSGAVDLLGEDDVFIAILEYGSDSRGTALFDNGPLPRRLRPADFTTSGLQRAMPGQSGVQVFCTEHDRPLCLYVVLGAHRRARQLVGLANEVLGSVEVAA